METIELSYPLELLAVNMSSYSRHFFPPLQQNVDNTRSQVQKKINDSAISGLMQSRQKEKRKFDTDKIRTCAPGGIRYQNRNIQV